MIKKALYIPAFIIFIIIGLVVKSFWDFPMWSALVAAVTTAGWLFAFADMFDSTARHGEQSVALYADFPTKSLRLLIFIKRAANTRIEQCQNYVPDSPLVTKQDITDTYSKILTDFDDTERDLHDISVQQERIKKGIIISNRLSSVCSIMGFLSIFCIFAFEPVANYFIACLDELTLISFALMLFTRYYESFVKNNLDNIEKRIKRTINGLEDLLNSLEKEVIENTNPHS